MSRTVKLTLEANVSGLVNGLKTASKATGDFTRDLGSWRQKNEAHLDTLGSAAGKAGLGIAAGLGLMGKAAMDWESSWTGVLKTVDGTPAQLGKVEDGLRGLAKTLPSTHAEIAGVAEAAGQLGVATDDVVDFTKVMIDLGQSTNLSAEEAATSLARFSNVMGTSNKDVGRLGATLVGLGNNYATTESEIMGMSMRLSGASKQIGLSEGQTMGLAAAMSSVGIEAEAGGSAMSLTMKRVGKAVDDGGSSLETFAGVSGMTAEDFQKAWKEDAAGALESFVLGLGKAGEDGESVNAILTELGITGIRESDALLRLSSAGELMGSSMKQGAEEYADGSALIEEATKRYETAESKVKIAWNNIKDAAITAGGVMLPIIASLAEGAANIADWFGKIPVPIQNFLTVLAGVSGVGLLAISGLINISKKANDLSTAFSAVYGTGGRASKAIGGVAKAMSSAVIVGAALMAGKAIIEGIGEAADKNRPKAEAFLNLITTDKGGDFASRIIGDPGKSEETLDMLSEKFGGVSKDAALLQQALEGMAGNDLPILGFFNKHLNNDELQGRVKGLGEAAKGLADAFSTNPTSAQDFFKGFAEEAKFSDEQVQELINRVPELRESLLTLATDNKIPILDDMDLVDLAMGRIALSAPEAADAIAGLGGAGEGAAGGLGSAETGIRGIAMSAEDAETAVDDFYDALVSIGAIALSERDALRGLEESFRAAADAAKENGKNLDITTEKGAANEAALDGIASATLSAVEAQEAQGRSAGDLAATMEKGRQAYIDQAVAMGMPKKEASALADQLNLIPSSVFMEFGTNAEGVSARVSELYEWVKAAPDGKIQIDDNSPEVRATLEALGFVVKDLPNGMIEVSEKGTDEAGKKIDAEAKKKRDAKITADAITKAAEDALNYAARDRSSTITTNAHTRYTSSGSSAVHRGGSGGQLDHWRGGRIPYLENGGKLPYTGLGRDMILGVNKQGRPVANVNDGEWVITEPMSAKHNDLLSAINSNDPRIDQMKSSIGLAGGGRVGAAEKKVSSTKRAYDRISGDKANRLRKLAAKDQCDAAKAELAAVKKSSKASADAAKKAADARKKAAEEEQARQTRLGESRRDLRVDLRRGEITDAFTSGSGMGQVDKLIDVSRNKDYSMGQRKGAARDANALEKALGSLTSKSEKLKTALEAAREEADELRSVRDAVSGGLRGEFSLGGYADQSEKFHKITAKGIIDTARGKANQIARFGGKLDKLRKLGYSSAIIQEVAELGSDEGGRVADALLGGSKTQVGALNKQYARLDYWSNQGGESVTKSMYQGGVDAALGVVNGLRHKTKDVENAFYKLGKAGEKAFRRSLDMHSPSRSLAIAGGDAVDGSVLGVDRNRHKLESAMAGLGLAGEAAFSMQPAFSVPPSAEVARYAAQPAPAQPMDAQAVAEAVWAIAQVVPIKAEFKVSNRKFAEAVATAQAALDKR